MKEYTVNIRVRAKSSVKVTAENAEAAINKARKMYEIGAVVIKPSPYIDCAVQYSTLSDDPYSSCSVMQLDYDYDD